ncbi:MAG TPA: SAM-dependent chlorinase/fluorinase [Chloroflexia bacterium]|nr:SAM-dependent chlorinase/fluorinase [Chloroflexia bacterium]
MTVITLLTDFGEADGYVGTMKGVILGLAPGTPIVDLSHAIAPQDVAAGAFVLGTAYPYFPPDTVHVAVVDPGVGSARRPLLLSTPRGRFIGPDNGLFSGVLAAEELVEAYHLDVPSYWLPVLSRTFHGRDIFAPCAAHLARGVPAAALGSPVPLDGLVRLPAGALTLEGDTLEGQVMHIDRFGNAVTNIPAALLAALGPVDAVIVTVGAHRLTGVYATYADVDPGGSVALIGSEGLLELAVRDGDGARELGLRVGDAVVCRLRQPDESVEYAR